MRNDGPISSEQQDPLLAHLAFKALPAHAQARVLADRAATKAVSPGSLLGKRLYGQPIGPTVPPAGSTGGSSWGEPEPAPMPQAMRDQLNQQRARRIDPHAQAAPTFMDDLKEVGTGFGETMLPALMQGKAAGQPGIPMPQPQPVSRAIQYPVAPPAPAPYVGMAPGPAAPLSLGARVRQTVGGVVDGVTNGPLGHLATADLPGLEADVHGAMGDLGALGHGLVANEAAGVGMVADPTMLLLGPETLLGRTAARQLALKGFPAVGHSAAQAGGYMGALTAGQGGTPGEIAESVGLGAVMGVGGHALGALPAARAKLNGLRLAAPEAPPLVRPTEPAPVQLPPRIEPPAPLPAAHEAPAPAQAGGSSLPPAREPLPLKAIEAPPPPRQEPLPPAHAESPADIHPAVPKGPVRVQRYEEPGAEPGTADKPHGLYTTPAEHASPHADLGGERKLYDFDPKNPLDVTESGQANVAHARFGRRQEGAPSAGVAAARELLPPDEFARLSKLGKAQLTPELAARFPEVDWDRYHDSYEQLEAVGAILARERGHDAITLRDKTLPEFTEHVALHPDVLRPVAGEAPSHPDFDAPAGFRREQAPERTLAGLVADEGGSFDMNEFARKAGIARDLRAATAAEKSLRAAGDTVRADQMLEKIQRLKDVRNTVLVRDTGAPGNPAAVTPTRYYNQRKYGFLNPASWDKFDEQVQATVARMQAAGQDPKTVIPFDEIRRRSRDILPDELDDLVRKGPVKGEAMPAAEYDAAKNYMEQVIKDSVDLEARINSYPAFAPPEPLAQMRAELTRMEKEAQGLLGLVTHSRSQKGRDLAYLKMQAQGSWDTTYWTSRANRLSGGHLASDIQRQLSSIVQRGEAAEAAGDAAGVRAARIDLSKTMGRLERTAPLEVLTTLRKAGMLTGLGTIQRNLAGNFAMQTMEEVARMPAAVIDIAMSLATGQRTVAVPGPVKIGRSLMVGAKEGSRQAVEVMKHGATEDDLARFEIPSEMNSGSKVLDLANHVFRFQSALDKPFFNYALQRAIEDRAALQKTTTALIKADESQMADALGEALFATFNNDTYIASAISKGMAGAPPTLKAFVDLLLPFKKVPLNVAARVLDYAVVGGAVKGLHAVGRKAWNGTLSEALTAGEQKAIAMGIGRGSVGSSLIYLGYKMGQNGRMTGVYSPETKDLDELAGRTPASIWYKGRWIPMSSVNPVGNLLSIGATLARGYENITAQSRADALAPGAKTAGGMMGDFANLFGAVAPIAAKTVLDQPLTQGAKEMADLAQDPEKSAGKFAGSLASSFVPSFVNDMAKGTDDTKREVAKDIAHAIPQSMQNRLPGFFPGPGRPDLPAHQDALGQEIRTPSGLNAVNILAGSRDRTLDNPVIAHLLEAGIVPPKPPKTVRIDNPADPMSKAVDVALTADEQRLIHRDMGTRIGHALERLMADPGYQKMEPDDQRAEIHAEIVGAHKEAIADFTDSNAKLLAERAPQAGAQQEARKLRLRVPGSPKGTSDADTQRISLLKNTADASP